MRKEPRGFPTSAGKINALLYLVTQTNMGSLINTEAAERDLFRTG
jgi:hypothetical protein